MGSITFSFLKVREAAQMSKIKKSTIQNVDSFEMRRGGGSRFSDFPLYSNDRNMALILMIYWLDISDM